MTQDFVQANRAFELFTFAEKERALEHFAQLAYPSVRERFFEAVHRVITEIEQQQANRTAILRAQMP